MAFTNTRFAQNHLKMNFDKDYYLTRTKRNHFWLGGIDGQMQLHQMKVGIAGLGGMGSNLAEIMVRLGVGHIKIADPDIIEVSNLNRQVIANKATVGQKKSTASMNELRGISEDFELVVYEDGITEENAEEFVSDLDVIIDEIDVFPLMAHVWLHRAANKKNIPLYSGFIIGLGTHIFKFQGDNYTFEDFMNKDMDKIKNPTLPFIVDRFANPLPSYMQSKLNLNRFIETCKDDSVPIFGASTFISHSLLAIRLVSDFLGLDKTLKIPKTPVMPEFLKLDPLEMILKIHNIQEQKPIIS